MRSVFERITVAGGGLRKLVCDDGASYDLLDVADVESFVDERGNVVIKGPSERDLVFASDRSSHRGVMPGAEYSIAAVAGVQGQPGGACAKKWKRSPQSRKGELCCLLLDFGRPHGAKAGARRRGQR